MDDTVNFIKSLADKNRLMILTVLHQYTLCVCDIQKIIPLTQGALSIQLQNLSKLGLLTSLKKGKRAFYRLSDNISKPRMQVLAVLFQEMKDNKHVAQAMKIAEKANPA